MAICTRNIEYGAERIAATMFSVPLRAGFLPGRYTETSRYNGLMDRGAAIGEKLV
jgi:hypothetical protein